MSPRPGDSLPAAHCAGEILDVDLIGFEQGDRARRAAVVDGVMRSLTTGFVYVAHDLPEEELDACYAQLAHFFALPLEEKNRYHDPDSRGQRGYTGVLVETAAGRKSADWKEMLNWGAPAAPESTEARAFPDRYQDPIFPETELPGIGDRLLRFHRQIASLQQRFLRIVAAGLGAPVDFFDSMVESGATLTRAVHYPPMTKAPKPGPKSGHESEPRSGPKPEPHVWAAAHGDINLVTALPRATAAGLEVQTERGWKPVAPPTGHAVLNSGLMLEHFSNGRIPTGWHRVVAQPDQKGSRLAVVQFCHPTPSTMLAPMESCIDADHPAHFSTLSAADRLDEVLREINLDTTPR